MHSIHTEQIQLGLLPVSLSLLVGEKTLTLQDSRSTIFREIVQISRLNLCLYLTKVLNSEKEIMNRPKLGTLDILLGTKIYSIPCTVEKTFMHLMSNDSLEYLMLRYSMIAIRRRWTYHYVICRNELITEAITTWAGRYLWIPWGWKISIKQRPF